MQNNPPLIGSNKIRILNPFVPPTMIQDNRNINRTKIFADNQIPLENKFQQQQQPQQPMPFCDQMKDGFIDDMPYQNFQQQSSHQQLASAIPIKFDQPNNQQGWPNEQFQEVNFQQKNEQNKGAHGIRFQNKQVGQNNFQNPLIQQDNQINQLGINQQQQNQTKPQTQPNSIQIQSKSPIAKQVDQHAFQNQFQQTKPPNQLVFNQQYEDNRRRESIKTLNNNQQIRPPILNQQDWSVYDHLSREQILAKNDYTEFNNYFDECTNLTKNIYGAKPKKFEELQPFYDPQACVPFAKFDSNQQSQPLNPFMAKDVKQLQKHQQDMKYQIPPNPPLPNFKQNPTQQQAAQFKPNELNQQNDKDLFKNIPNQQLPKQNAPTQQQQPPQVLPTNEVKQQNQKKQIKILPSNQIKNKRPNEQQSHKSKNKNNIQLLGFSQNLTDDLIEQRDIFGLKKGQNVNELMDAQKQLGIDQMDDAQLYEYFTQIDLNNQKGLSSNVIQDIQTFKIQDEQIEEECSICQENFLKGDDLCSLPCLHIFHSNCIKTCFERFKICPICRQPVI